MIPQRTEGRRLFTAKKLTVYLEMARDIGYLAGARGHFVTAGTPEQIAELMVDWFTAGAADGFNIMPPLLPVQFEAFANEVVPLLQRRGLFRTEYEGTTLREHYGLDWPAGTFDSERSAAQ